MHQNSFTHRAGSLQAGKAEEKAGRGLGRAGLYVSHWQSTCLFFPMHLPGAAALAEILWLPRAGLASSILPLMRLWPQQRILSWGVPLWGALLPRLPTKQEPCGRLPGYRHCTVCLDLPGLVAHQLQRQPDFFLLPTMHIILWRWASAEGQPWKASLISSGSTGALHAHPLTSISACLDPAQTLTGSAVLKAGGREGHRETWVGAEHWAWLGKGPVLRVWVTVLAGRLLQGPGTARRGEMVMEGSPGLGSVSLT